MRFQLTQEWRAQYGRRARIGNLANVIAHRALDWWIERSGAPSLLKNKC
jgi:hypothetical protein